MEVDRGVLIKLLEAFADTSEVLHRELMLHQMLFTAACHAKGLNKGEIENAIHLARQRSMERINAACRPDHQSLLEKLPQIVDLLASHQDEALRVLKEFVPKGKPN
jgi:hypothetical protein